MAESPNAQCEVNVSVAALVVALASAVVATAVSLTIGGRDRPPLNFGELASVLQWDLVMVTACVVGYLVARKRRGNAIVWPLSLGGALGALGAAADTYAAFAGHVEPHRPAGDIAWLASTALLYLSWGALGVFVPLLFPDGHLRSKRWRPFFVAGIFVTASAAAIIFSPSAFEEAGGRLTGRRNPLGAPAALEPLFDLLFTVGLLGLFALLAVGIGGLFLRLRTASGVERQQLRVVAWAAAASLFVGVALALLMGPVAGTLFAPVVDLASHAIPLLLPAAVGVAILRYRLYDVDVVINRTLVWTGMSLFITGIYVAVVAGVAAVAGHSDQPNLAVSILATAIVATGFQPVRERMQRLAARIVYGQQSSPYEVLTGFSRRVADAFEFDEVLPRMAEAAATGVNAMAARVVLDLGQGETVDATWPADVPMEAADHEAAIAHQGEEVGRLMIRMRPGDSLTAPRRRLLDDLAAHAGVVLHNTQLAAELAARLAEVRASRQRIVMAGDAARRAVERDLHDGAQQRLVALGLLLRFAASELAREDGAAATSLLSEASTELEVALSELRDLARGIHPAVLVDGGLPAALESLAETAPMPVQLEVPPVRFPADVEVTAYFVVSEALANVAKHAQATRARVCVREDDGVVELMVTDDGRGGADMARGSGLRGLSDRVAALDGTLRVESAAGSGTSLVARLPCG